MLHDEVVFHILCMYAYHLVPSFPPVLAELRQDELISCVESKRLSDLKCNDVVRVQSGKPPDVLVKTAGILSRHGFDGHAAFLEGA